MADSPPRRIGQLTPHPLHAPNQRHHIDPAKPRDEIRNLGTDKIPSNNRVQAEPDKGDTGAPTQASNDHAAAVQAEITAQARQEHAGSHPTFPAGGISL